MRVPRVPDMVTLIAAVAAPGLPASAQEEDLTRPPRIDDAPLVARLTEPSEERAAALEEVLVVGENEWRLPDLGSRWRAEAAATAELGRIEADLLPLFDPEDPAHTRADWFIVNEEIRRVGFIELFKVRFGRRDVE